MKRRRYERCAKCGNLKPATQAYVCDNCHGTPGLYRFCAVCGGLVHNPPQATRAYVCEKDLAAQQ